MTQSVLSVRIATRTSMSKADTNATGGAVFSPIANAIARGQTVSIAGYRTFDTYGQGNQT